MSDEDAGAEFAQALGVKDFSRIRTLLADDIDFRGLTPGSYWEANTADEVIDEILFEWFEDRDEIQRVLACSTDSVGDRHHVSYLFDVRNPDGRFLVEVAIPRFDGHPRSGARPRRGCPHGKQTATSETILHAGVQG